MYMATACLFLTGLERLSLRVPCVMLIAQLLLQLAAWAQILSLEFLATESDAMAEIHISFGYK